MCIYQDWPLCSCFIAGVDCVNFKCVHTVHDYNEMHVLVSCVTVQVFKSTFVNFSRNHGCFFRTTKTVEHYLPVPVDLQGNSPLCVKSWSYHERLVTEYWFTPYLLFSSVMISVCWWRSGHVTCVKQRVLRCVLKEAVH